ncbi:Coiled-coil domain-containing protein 13 [Phytophthora citrophthora]|uniref:Coiled-coil domain-containing protein 13 n=1 Tax=Phytophthora citrophthora TaxID=4793 RepID=A0AAD9LHL2_9STRA|nr:Coiled-coil domain-containing protein 13 [Phytophthora citrophthora]
MVVDYLVNEDDVKMPTAMSCFCSDFLEIGERVFGGRRLLNKNYDNSSLLMEGENTHMHVHPDGKKLIDITLRHQVMPPQQAPLVVPRFDDEDDSSSSDEDDDDEPAFSSLTKKQYARENISNNDEEDHDQSILNRPQQTFQDDIQWDRVQELQELTNANATLTSEARDLRQQVKTLQIQLEAQTPVPGLDVDAVQDILLEKDNIEHDVRDVKIVHQAKTLRTLKRSLQREKQLAVDAAKHCKTLDTSNRQLEEQVDTLKLKLQRFQARAAAEKNNKKNNVDVPSQNQQPEAPETSSSDPSGNHGALKKLYEELKSKTAALQQELKKTQRALTREVGDDIPLDEIVGNTDNSTSGASRRGRAQQIIMLKAKVKKLQAQLRAGHAPIEGNDAATTLDVDQRAQQDLTSQHLHRQKLIDQLTNQRDELEERVHRSTRKYDALKARAQILDREKQETRNKFQVLVEKSRTDDALVDALQRQLETWKTKLHEARRARTADSARYVSHDERAELERLRKVVAEHKSRGGDRAASPMGPAGGGMPLPSEASLYRAMAVEKERLVEVVRGLKIQLEDKDKLLRSVQSGSELASHTSLPPTPVTPSLPPIGDESRSRIPRRPSSKIPLPSGRSSGVSVSASPDPSAVIMEKQNQQLKREIETLRQTFRESMREKDERIAELEHQSTIMQPSSTGAANDADAMSQELSDLQEENDFLRQEFDKLKTRYEALIKPTAVDNKKTNNRAGK